MLGYLAMKLQYVCHCHFNVSVTGLLVCWKDIPGDSDEFEGLMYSLAHEVTQTKHQHC